MEGENRRTVWLIYIWNRVFWYRNTRNNFKTKYYYSNRSKTEGVGEDVDVPDRDATHPHISHRTLTSTLVPYGVDFFDSDSHSDSGENFFPASDSVSIFCRTPTPRNSEILFVVT
jgi:hypothetical protein